MTGGWERCCEVSLEEYESFRNFLWNQLKETSYTDIRFSSSVALEKVGLTDLMSRIT